MNDENNNNHYESKPNLALLSERVRQIFKRLNHVEKKQEELTTMVNRYIGGIALLVGIGVLAGWWMTIKGGLPLIR